MLLVRLETWELFLKLDEKWFDVQSFLTFRPISSDKIRIHFGEGTFSVIWISYKKIGHHWDVQETLKSCVEIACISEISEALHYIL
jgi:hypothetical protein